MTDTIQSCGFLTSGGQKGVNQIIPKTKLRAIAIRISVQLRPGKLNAEIKKFSIWLNILQGLPLDFR
jgi:hypothetical protein